MAVNVLQITPHSLRDDVDKHYCELSYKYNLNKRFKIGDGIPLDEEYKLHILDRILSRCYVPECIDNNKIAEELKKITL